MDNWSEEDGSWSPLTVDGDCIKEGVLDHRQQQEWVAHPPLPKDLAYHNELTDLSQLKMMDYHKEGVAAHHLIHDYCFLHTEL